MRSSLQLSKSIMVVILTFIFCILFIKIKTFFNFYDEGFAMFGATRVLHGDIPYRDFWAIYPPGQFYIVAAVIKLFGPDLIAARIYDTLLRFLLVIVVFLLAKRLTHPLLAILTAIITGFLVASAGFYSYAVFPAMTLGLWAIWSWLVYTERGSIRFLFIAGAFLGIAAIIRWDIGIYAAASLLVPAYLLLLASNNQPITASPTPAIANHPQTNRFRLACLLSPFKILGWVLVPMISIILLGYGWIGLQSGWKNLYEQVFYFPTFVLHSVRWLPYPNLAPSNLIQTIDYYDYHIPVPNLPSEDWFRFYLPIFTLSVALIILAINSVKNFPHHQKKNFAILSVILLGALLFNQALSRYDFIHVIPASILTFLVAAAIFHQFSGQNPWIKNLFFGLVIVLTALYFIPSLKDLLGALDTAAPWGCYSQNKKASCAGLMSDEEQAAQFLLNSTKPSDKIFVGNQKHDRIFVNDIGLYYLADRQSGTRYHELYPGVATTLPVQMEIARDLKENQVNWVVLVKLWDSNEPNGSAISSGVTYLDDYLRANYNYVADFGNYQIRMKSPQ